MKKKKVEKMGLKDWGILIGIGVAIVLVFSLLIYYGFYMTWKLEKECGVTNSDCSYFLCKLNFNLRNYQNFNPDGLILKYDQCLAVQQRLKDLRSKGLLNEEEYFQ